MTAGAEEPEIDGSRATSAEEQTDVTHIMSRSPPHDLLLLVVISAAAENTFVRLILNQIKMFVDVNKHISALGR